MPDKNYRILVIDDCESIHQDFRKILMQEEESLQVVDEVNKRLLGKTQTKKKLPPFQIDSALQGEDGVKKVQQALLNNKPYAVAFVDIIMPPGEDGIQTIVKIWEKDPDIQTVICTAYSTYSWDDIMERFGDTDRLFVLKKPFDNLEIIQLACSLSNKWNLKKSMGDHLFHAEAGAQSSSKDTVDDKQTDMKKSISNLKESISALTKLNERLKNKQQ